MDFVLGFAFGIIAGFTIISVIAPSHTESFTIGCKSANNTNEVVQIDGKLKCISYDRAIDIKK